MASSLFPQHSNQTAQPSNPLASRLAQVKQMANGNPQSLFNSMMQSNPNFKRFVQNNQGKTPQQIAKENGFDFNQLQSLFRS